MAAALSYEDLRKHARHLENEIDLKLVAFSKLGAGIKSPPSHSAADTVPLLSGEDTFEAMALEIEELLNKLTQVNERMAEQPVSGAAMLHTLQRHRDILTDLSRDFRKTTSQHEVRREREDLLRGSNDSFRSDGVNNRRDMYLKENQHIHRVSMMLKPHQPWIIRPKQEIEPSSGVLQQLLLLPTLPSNPSNDGNTVLIPGQQTTVGVLKKQQTLIQKPYFSSVKGYIAEHQGVGPICRTCYRVIYNNNFVKLYEDENEGVSEKLRNMLKQVVRTIDLEIYLEPIMCTKCVKKLFDCHDFLTKCSDTEVKFNHWVSQRKRVKQEEVNLLILVENSTDGDKDIIDIEQPPKEDKVELINLATSEEVQNDDDLVKIQPPKEDKVELINLAASEEVQNDDDDLVKMDHNYSSLNGSVLTDHSYAVPSQATSENKKIKIKLNATERMRRIRAKQERKKGPFLCELCGYLAKSRISFTMHLSSHEGDPPIDGIYRCEKCPYMSKDPYRMKNHAIRHAEPIHQCAECDKRFKVEKALQLHIKNIHSGDPERLQCHICGKSFKYQTSLRIHLRNHDPEKPLRYVCEVCGKRFSSAVVCRKHLITHSGERYPCELCGRQLKRKQNLQKHREIYHENSGKFKCDVCKRSFWKMEDLTRHKIKHDTFGQEQKCDICEIYYSNRGQLLNHLAEVHGQFFECGDCGAKLTSRHSLKKHREMSHGKFKCEICDKGYRRKSDLLNHALKIHGFKVEVEEEEDCAESVETQADEIALANLDDFNLDKENVLVEPIEVLGFF